MEGAELGEFAGFFGLGAASGALVSTFFTAFGAGGAVGAGLAGFFGEGAIGAGFCGSGLIFVLAGADLLVFSGFGFDLAAFGVRLEVLVTFVSEDFERLLVLVLPRIGLKADGM